MRGKPCDGDYFLGRSNGITVSSRALDWRSDTISTLPLSRTLHSRTGCSEPPALLTKRGNSASALKPGTDTELSCI